MGWGQDTARQINEMFAPEDKPQERPGIYNKIKQWVNKFLDGVRSLFDSKAKGLTYDELVRMPMKALFDDTESARFMEALAQVNEEEVDLSSQGDRAALVAKTQSLVDAFGQKYNIYHTHVLMSDDADAIRAIPAFDYEFSGIKDDTEREQTIQYVLDQIKNNEDINAITLDKSGEIIIFADRVNTAEAVETACFHEGTHSWLRRQFGYDTPRSVCENYWIATEKRFSTAHRNIESELSNESQFKQHEEFFVYKLHDALVRGSFDNIDPYLDELGRHYVDKLLNEFGYDRQREGQERNSGKGEPDWIRIYRERSNPRLQQEAEETSGRDERGGRGEVESSGDPDEGVLFRELDEDEDAELIDRLESEPKITTYSTKVKVDDGYIPPMSSRDNETGELRKPEHEGKWNEAEERPDLAYYDEKSKTWKFDLGKSNGKDVNGVAAGRKSLALAWLQ